MATTKIIPEVLDLRGGLPDYSLAATNTVSYLNAGGGNQYNFNGAYGLYGVVNGTYVLSSVSSSHPIAILNNGKTSLISYTGAVNEGSQTGPDGNTYTYYSGDVTITVSGNFDVVSYACKIHGYMGGQNNLIYTNLHSELGLKIPTGTQFNRPATDVAGMIRNNTNETSASSASCQEYYNGATWQKINNNALQIAINFMVIGGGATGSGGYGDSSGGIGGAGGGAGGLRTSFGSTSGGGASAESSLTLTGASVYTIVVGAGGSTPPNPTGFYSTGNDGNDSSLSGSGITTITSFKGGRGGSRLGGNGNGGNGTYGSGGANATDSAGAGVTNAGTTGQGFASGGTVGSGTTRSSSGGGGAAGAGAAATASNAGAGGNGLAVSITGSSIIYAGGGGGGATSGSATATSNMASGSTGGANGGGDAADGAVNTGAAGGGGGAGNSAGKWGLGGSGVIVLRLPTASYSGTTSGSPTVTTDGSDTILTYTGSGTYTA